MTIFIIGITEHVSVTDLQFCKHEDLRVAWERKSISSILEEIKTHINAFILSETTVISSFVTAIGGVISLPPKLVLLAIQDMITNVAERLTVSTEGPSWRWRFQPWKKSSMDNEFDPDRIHPPIEMPTLPISKQLEMAIITFKQRFSYIFKFKEDNQS